MSFKGIAADLPVLSKLLIFGGIAALCGGLFTVTGAVFSSLIYNVDLLGSLSFTGIADDPNKIAALKLMQTFSASGLFIVSPLISGYIFSRSPFHYIYMSRQPSALIVLLSILTFICCIPVINFLMLVNEQMKLPEFLSGLEEWMKTSEEQAALLTEAFLMTDTVLGLFINVIVVALIPAFGEELFFRGILQRLCIEATQLKNISIIVTAFLFSAIHLQFYGFLPRFILGLMLGYMVMWSGSLWVSIVAHFINNGLAVFLAYVTARQQLPFNHDAIGTLPEDKLILTISIALTSSILYLIYKFGKRVSIQNE